MIGSFSHHKLGNLKIKSALVFIPSILSLLLVRKIMLLLPDTLFQLIALTLQRIINHDRVCLSNDCNLRFHDSQIKENQSKEINF
jgi:hypothetical protein